MRHIIVLIALLAATSLPARDRQNEQAIYTRLRNLDLTLRQADSATLVLQTLCASHRLADPATIRAEQQAVPPVPLTARKRRHLKIGPNEPVVYRRVKLMCGDHLLSDAENWYVPARLTPDMNRQLTETTTPFGIAIRPLRPARDHLATEWLWQPGRKGGVPQALLRHRALVLDGEGRPLAEVAETYQRDTVVH